MGLVIFFCGIYLIMKGTDQYKKNPSTAMLLIVIGVSIAIAGGTMWEKTGN